MSTPQTPPYTSRAAAPDYMAPLVRYRSFVILFVLSAVITSLALTYVFSEKYESYTTISYRAQEITRFQLPTNQSMGSPAPQAPFKVVGQTLQEVLKSDAVLSGVVKAQHLDEKKTPVYDGPWYKVWYSQAKDWTRETLDDAWTLLKYGRLVEEDPTAQAIAELRKNIKVVNRDSYVLQLVVRDKYPDRAARIANDLAQVLANWLIEFDREPGRARVAQLRTLLDEKTAAMEERRAEIAALLTSSRAASVELETQRLTENLFAVRLEESRLASEIARTQSRRSAGASKLQIKQRILSEDAPPAETSEYISPDDFRKLASQQLADDLELKSLLAKRESLKVTVDNMSARLNALPTIQSRLDTLRQTLASLEREHGMLDSSYQEAVVRASSSVSEVRILHPAVVPAGPVTPIKVYHVLLAGALGLVLAVGLVYLLTFLNIRILFPSRGLKARTQPRATPEEPQLTPAKEVTKNG